MAPTVSRVHKAGELKSDTVICRMVGVIIINRKQYGSGEHNNVMYGQSELMFAR